ncbi:helix-turn-helix domain-containing protein [Photobacterium damselae]|uniref:helix-turn-helix domain-containing protein n=1 Tax=Photobacterium damselae TaxID=38293 RepID=UPI000DD384AB|nr:helix-turn-helix transcriptional regulator [Photobacterium damselae subsp. damselae]
MQYLNYSSCHSFHKYEVYRFKVQMSKIANNTGYNTSVSTIETLCKFFNCRVEDVMEYKSDSTSASE